MVTKKRLDRVEEGLNITQMVLLEIEGVRRYPDVMAHAMAMIRHPLSPDKTLCGRVEAGVLQATKGQPERRRNEAVRAAQKQALFLAYLASECNYHIASTTRERELEGVVLIALRGLCAATGADEAGATNLFKVALAVGNRLREQAEAICLIERAHFDGQTILYPRAAADVQYRIREADEVADWARERLDDLGTGRRVTSPRKPAPSRSPRRVAHGMVVAAKAKVLYEFNQDAAADAVLRTELGTDVSPATITRPGFSHE